MEPLRMRLLRYTDSLAEDNDIISRYTMWVTGVGYHQHIEGMLRMKDTIRCIIEDFVDYMIDNFIDKT